MKINLKPLYLSYFSDEETFLSKSDWDRKYSKASGHFKFTLHLIETREFDSFIPIRLRSSVLTFLTTEKEDSQNAFDGKIESRADTISFKKTKL